MKELRIDLTHVTRGVYLDTAYTNRYICFFKARTPRGIRVRTTGWLKTNIFSCGNIIIAWSG